MLAFLIKHCEICLSVCSAENHYICVCSIYSDTPLIANQCWIYVIKWEKKNHHRVWTIPTPNRKIIERVITNTSNKHTWPLNFLDWYRVTETKKGKLKLVYGSNLTLTSELAVQHDPMFLSSSSAKSRSVSARNLWVFLSEHMIY